VADFGELTIDMLINSSAGKGGRLFDFGTGEDECFYLAIEGQGGKGALTARHKGKSYSVTASEGIPANKWARVRVEIDGSTASIHIDGKQVARKGFAFRPRMVFIADLPEGNFIACGRNKDEFFKGRMDHFRIYRKVHDDFNALGPAPFALTQMQEWSEKDQQRADAWAGRRRAKEAELRAGKYGQMQEEIGRLQQRESALRKTAKLAELEARARKAENEKRRLIEQAEQKREEILNQAAGPQYKELLALIQQYGAAQTTGADPQRLQQLRDEIDGKLDEAIGQVAKLLGEARTRDSEIREAVRREVEDFKYQLEAYRKHPKVTVMRLWTKMREAILSSKENEILFLPPVGEIEILINTDPNRAIEAEMERYRRRGRPSERER